MCGRFTILYSWSELRRLMNLVCPSDEPNPRFSKQGKKGTPFYITRRDKQIVLMAGLFDRWKRAGGEVLETVTIITTQAEGPVAEIHAIISYFRQVLRKNYREVTKTGAVSGETGCCLSL